MFGYQPKGIRSPSPDINPNQAGGKDVNIRAIVIDDYNTGAELAIGKPVTIVRTKRMDERDMVKITGSRKWWLRSRFTEFVK